MFRRASGVVIRDNMVLLVKLKEQDRMLPRDTWVFPFIPLQEDMSPRKELGDFLDRLNLEYGFTDRVFRYNPTENPKLTYFLYVLEYRGGEPEVGSFFQTYKWVPIKDITAYSTSFMDFQVSKYLNEVADKAEKFKQ